jgi:hypothetical protein
LVWMERVRSCKKAARDARWLRRERREAESTNAITCRGELLELAVVAEGGHDDGESRAWRGWGLFIYRAGARLQSVRLAGAGSQSSCLPTHPLRLLHHLQLPPHLLACPPTRRQPPTFCSLSPFLPSLAFAFCFCMSAAAASHARCLFLSCLVLSCLVTSHTPMLHLQSRWNGTG